MATYLTGSTGRSAASCRTDATDPSLCAVRRTPGHAAIVERPAGSAAGERSIVRGLVERRARRSTSPHAAAAATAKNTANTTNSTGAPPAISSGGTTRGATIDAMRPTPAAHPVPVARSDVGYISGVTAYSAPQAPRLKNDSAIPAAMIGPGPFAVPKKTADTAEPTRNTERVARRPQTSISHAATAYPGSWASVITRVKPNERTRS